jgi:hypothetical protein
MYSCSILLYTCSNIIAVCSLYIVYFRSMKAQIIKLYVGSIIIFCLYCRMFALYCFSLYTLELYSRSTKLYFWLCYISTSCIIYFHCSLCSVDARILLLFPSSSLFFRTSTVREERQRGAIVCLCSCCMCTDSCQACVEHGLREPVHMQDDAQCFLQKPAHIKTDRELQLYTGNYHLKGGPLRGEHLLHQRAILTDRFKHFNG